ncbi:MAG TPA: conjugal transfer protein [Solirubrobacteraceae bacterium]|jgi:hypothetical protein|nr:conjugal transfer protein [Solirubrobacteraceae bacterium]
MAAVSLQRHPLWRIRASRELPRYALIAAAFAGLLASARFALDPPRTAPAAIPAASLASPDLAAQAYATLFARRYLSWDARQPERMIQELEPFVGSKLQPAAGFAPPPRGQQHVAWAEVVQTREPAPGTHVYTVAADTTAGLLYLTVGVTRTAEGKLALTGYPAFVGAPASQPANPETSLRPVEDATLETVIARGLGNYLDGAGSELASDLAPGAIVAPPAVPLQLVSVGRQLWAPGGGSVMATVQASDGGGARYTLTYEIDVIQVHGRWEISAVQTQPDA